MDCVQLLAKLGSVSHRCAVIQKRVVEITLIAIISERTDSLVASSDVSDVT